MKEKIRTILESLKERKIAVSTIEKDLGFSNGLLAKAKETGGLSDEKFEQLQKYADLKINGVDRSGLHEQQENIYPPKMVVEKLGNLSLKPSDETLKKMKATNDKINKDFGEGTIMRWGDKPDTNYQVISTGSLLLDKALGIGGLPRGRMVEIFGMESSGKSTITLHVIANAQKQGLKCLLIDAENSFDPEYAAALDVVVDELEYCQPSYGEEGFEVADKKILSEEADVVIIDSVAAMIPKAELEGAIGDSKMGLHARLMSQVCRKMVGTIAKRNALVIFINQIRNKIGVMYGSPEVTTGGMALQFYASIRLRVSRSISNENSIMNGEIKEGNQTTVKVIKNKCAPPLRSAQFNIIYGKGVDSFGEIVDMAIEMGIIKQAGSWFSYNNDKLGQGKGAVKQVLLDNPDLLKRVEDEVRGAVAK